MALKVRTAHGKTFHRCGLTFGKTWTVVDDETLAKPFGTPKPTKKSPTIAKVLKRERMLVCEAADKGKDSGKK